MLRKDLCHMGRQTYLGNRPCLTWLRRRKKRTTFSHFQPSFLTCLRQVYVCLRRTRSMHGDPAPRLSRCYVIPPPSYLARRTRQSALLAQTIPIKRGRANFLGGEREVSYQNNQFFFIKHGPPHTDNNASPTFSRCLARRRLLACLCHARARCVDQLLFFCLLCARFRRSAALLRACGRRSRLPLLKNKSRVGGGGGEEH